MAWNAIVRDSGTVSARSIGQEWMTKTERMLHKCLQVRAELVSPENQYDILYSDITADWEHAIQGVYDFLHRPFTSEARQKMQIWIDSNRQHKHGAHTLCLDSALFM